jgi:hypothetical protein
MAVLLWDQSGQRLYETGVDKGVLYIPDASGNYPNGVAWNGLVNVTETPSGAEATALYADNTKYLNMYSNEEFAATIEAYTYPVEWNQFDGVTTPQAGVNVSQQARKSFGLAFRTRLGNDLLGNDYGYKLHMVYGATASPSERAFGTINDSPEAITFSWECMTVPVAVSGAKPTSLITVNSTLVNPTNLTNLENALFGTAGTAARLPLPDEVIAMFSGAQTLVTPTMPTFVSATGVITIPTVTGVTYKRADTGATVAPGTVTIAGGIGAYLHIFAVPTTGLYAFNAASDDRWVFVRTA